MKKLVLILTVLLMMSLPVTIFAVDHDNPHVVNPNPQTVISE